MLVPMLRSVLLAVLAASLAVVSGRAEAAEADCVEAPSAALVPDLLGWIALNTMYSVKAAWDDPPEVSFCDVGEAVAYEGLTLTIEPFLAAAYDLRARRIYLVRPWSEDDLRDVSVLLHELIHDVQLGDHEWPCSGAPEFEAYWLQDKWLSERGIVSGFDWRLIIKMSTCPAK